MLRFPCQVKFVIKALFRATKHQLLPTAEIPFKPNGLILEESGLPELDCSTGIKCNASITDHLRVACSVTWPLNGSKAGGDLALIYRLLWFCHVNATS